MQIRKLRPRVVRQLSRSMMCCVLPTEDRPPGIWGHSYDAGRSKSSANGSPILFPSPAPVRPQQHPSQGLSVGCRQTEKAREVGQGAWKSLTSFLLFKLQTGPWAAALTAAPPGGAPRDLWAGGRWESRRLRNSTGCPQAGRQKTQASLSIVETTANKSLRTAEQ